MNNQLHVLIELQLVVSIQVTLIRRSKIQSNSKHVINNIDIHFGYLVYYREGKCSFFVMEISSY